VLCHRSGVALADDLTRPRLLLTLIATDRPRNRAPPPPPPPSSTTRPSPGASVDYVTRFGRDDGFFLPSGCREVAFFSCRFFFGRTGGTTWKCRALVARDPRLFTSTFRHLHSQVPQMARSGPLSVADPGTCPFVIPHPPPSPVV